MPRPPPHFNYFFLTHVKKMIFLFPGKSLQILLSHPGKQHKTMSFLENLSEEEQIAILTAAQQFEKDNQVRKKPVTEECGASLMCGDKEYTSTCFYNCVLVFLKEDVDIVAHTLALDKKKLPVGDDEIKIFVELRGVSVEVFEITCENSRVYKPSDWKGDTVIKLWLENGHYTLIRDLDYK